MQHSRSSRRQFLAVATGTLGGGIAIGHGSADENRSIGQEIILASRTPIYRRARPSSEVVTTLSRGTTGTIINGPVERDVPWWGIRFEGPVWGWVPADVLTTGPEKPVGLRGTFRRPAKDLATFEDTVDEYAAAGVTDLALNVFYHGETIYPSAHTTSKDYPDGFLDAAIDYAHDRGIRVHGWLLMGYQWNPRYLGPVPEGHLLDGEDSLCVEGTCSTVDRSLLARARDGSYTAESGKLFVSPFSTDALDKLQNVVSEADEQFDFDGLMFDYVRFPKSQSPFGYGPAAPRVSETELHSRRESAVAEMVATLASTPAADTTTSAAVFPAYYTSDARSEYHKSQAWRAWRSATSLDWFVPMCYGYESYAEQLQFCADLQTDEDVILPALAITEDHDTLATQYDVWQEHSFPGYMVWKGETIQGQLP